MSRCIPCFNYVVFVGFSQGLAVFCGENSQGSESFETSESNQQSQGSKGEVTAKPHP